jgi:excisionase family DNA binding protein
MKYQSSEAAAHDTLVMLTTAQVCDLLQADRKKISRLVAEHGLPRVRVGGSNRYLLRDVIAWVEAHRVAYPATEPRSESISDADREVIVARLVRAGAKGGRTS